MEIWAITAIDALSSVVWNRQKGMVPLPWGFLPLLNIFLEVFSSKKKKWRVSEKRPKQCNKKLHSFWSLLFFIFIDILSLLMRNYVTCNLKKKKKKLKIQIAYFYRFKMNPKKIVYTAVRYYTYRWIFKFRQSYEET